MTLVSMSVCVPKLVSMSVCVPKLVCVIVCAQTCVSVCVCPSVPNFIAWPFLRLVMTTGCVSWCSILGVGR